MDRCEFSKLLEVEDDVDLIWTGRSDISVFKFGVASGVSVCVVEGAGELANVYCKRGVRVFFAFSGAG